MLSKTGNINAVYWCAFTVCVCERERGRQLMLWLFPLVSAVPSFFYAPTVVEPQHEAPPGSKNRKRKKPGLCVCVFTANRLHVTREEC